MKEHKLREQADLLAEKGLNTAGYSTFIVECGWEDWVNKDGSPKVSSVKLSTRDRPEKQFQRIDDPSNNLFPT